SLSDSFLPVLPKGFRGYTSAQRDELEKKGRGFNEGPTNAEFGSRVPYDVRIAIHGPAGYTYNSVGVVESDEIREGRRTTVWRSDHPVSFFNVVAGQWSVRRGPGVAVYYYPAHHYNLDEITRVLAAARKHYSSWFGEYAWQELKLSEFPALADYAQG